ncbi:hypothetical protein [Deinococcus sp. Leaf326]|uniref:hypothetical protein n=1 Tax=Deinococcus sp. Leaf326 TaxID=1736338 RepID=UPI0006F30583|nr:hypothetical protein [Deinococcus sp. Leaf326]KQR22875.1 hypothetical protein ASF71_06830 [Deinococcus sp. Leaf326]
MTVTPEKLRDFLAPYRTLWDHYAADAWAWAKDCVRTRDEDAKPGQPREHLPLPNLPHLEWMTWAWYSVNLLQIDKSRQMMATWIVCALTMHEAMFVEASNAGYQHMDAGETAKKMEKYMLYVLEGQPMTLMMPWVELRAHPPTDWVKAIAEEFDLSMTPKTPPTRTDLPAEYGSEAYEVALTLCNRYRKSSGAEGVNEIELRPYFSSSYRYVYGIPAGVGGPNKWRGDTRTRAIEDEAWFHAALADNINSAQKSVGQNGRQVLYSTANAGEDDYALKMIGKAPHQPEEFGGFGGRVVETADGVEVIPYEKRSVKDLPYGVEMWLSVQGYTHLRIWHYADPSKRSDEWIQRNIETGDRRKNMREVLIQYDAPIGEPFYPSFDYTRQRLEERPKSSEGAQLIIGMDGGRRPASLTALVYPSGRVVTVRELATPPGVSTNVRAHATALRRVLSADPLTTHWQKEHVLVLDPSMFDTRSETDDRTSAEVLQEMGFFVVKGSQGAAIRYEALTNLNLHRIQEDGRPALQVDAGACPTFYAAMMGNCTVAKGAEKTGAYIKEKNNASHITEAGEYLATYLDANPMMGENLDDLMLTVHRSRR